MSCNQVKVVQIPPKINTVKVKGSSHIVKVTTAQAPPGQAGLGWDALASDNYTDSSRLQLPAGIRTPLTLNAAGAAPGTRLTGKQLNHVLIQNGKIQPRASEDAFLFRLNFMGESELSNNLLAIDLDIAGAQGIIENDRTAFDPNAGEVSNFSFLFLVYALDTFIANGGTVNLKSKQAAEVWGFTLVYVPVFSK